MAQATIRFSDLKEGQKLDGSITRHIGWDVVDYTDEDDAISACAAPGDEHPQNSELKCTEISVVENKLTKAIVLATYEFAHAPIIGWKWGKNSQDIDTDLNGNAILNSTGDAFKSYGKKNFSVRFLTITQWETSYDQDAAKKFTDTVNKTAVSFEGQAFSPGQVYCLSIAPKSEYQKGANYLQVSYSFEIRTPSPLATGLTALQKRHPFQRRILDQGMRAPYSPPAGGKTLGPLFLASGNAITRDVLFDGHGSPIDAAIKVTESGYSVVANTLPKTVLVDPITAGGQTVAVFLVYQDYPEVDFSDIGVLDS